jgi:signal transduction histidine kinase
MERFRERLKEIDENIQRCQLVTRRLLGFLRSGAELELVPDDLGEVLRQAERYLRFHPSGCGVEVRIEAEPVGRVPMARDLLVQLFLNLFVNACEATGGMGTVRAGVRPAGDGVVEVTVADAGPGIPEELRARIFEPFVTTKPKGRGTGIGLFLVRYIVNQHRGRISVECPPQGGTLFRIVLPLEAAAP